MAERLDGDSIVAAAIRLADAEGADAISMRRVGGALGVSAMALYRHVGDRDALVGRMVASIAAESPLVDAGPDAPGWRETLDRLARTEWAAFERHPWLVDVAVGPVRLVDAMSAADTEAVLGRLVAAGAEPERAGDVFLGVVALVVGLARITLRAERGRVVDRPVDSAGPGGTADPADAGRETSDRPLAASFRAVAFDANLGRRALDTALNAYLDGVATGLADPE